MIHYYHIGDGVNSRHIRGALYQRAVARARTVLGRNCVLEVQREEVVLSRSDADGQPTRRWMRYTLVAASTYAELRG